jgi:hypothetical protein
MTGKVWEGVPTKLSPTPLEPERVIDTRIDQQVIYPLDSRFAESPGSISMEWTGYLLIEQPGHYSIATESDDGSAVYLNNELLVNNWGIHGRQVGRGYIDLQPGIYPITVRYFNANHGGMMTLLWTEPVGHLKPIPRRNLLVYGGRR